MITPSSLEQKLDISHALALDAADPLFQFRSRFHIPSKADLQRKTLAKAPDEAASDESIYLCGNSLGLQPKQTISYIDVFLTQWRTKAVTGHFVEHTDSPLAPFLHIDDEAAKLMAPLVGALPSEVAVMGTLTANLHLLLSSFYRPNSTRNKILMENKAFPSDHYAIESQIAMHDLPVDSTRIMLNPASPSEPILSTAQILDTITQHASSLALVLLPGIQFYTGQLFDIKRITSHAHSHGIMVGWDLAHAAGNVDLHLHDWDIDFAVWCTYKYLNSGPGAIASLFVHERHGTVDMQNADPSQRFRPRLTGWWGDDKSSRFQMTNSFVPRPGAGGYQLSNPSALDTAAVVSSLKIFQEAGGMAPLREKSLRLTAYLEMLLTEEAITGPNPPYRIISPRNPEERGAQLSVRLESGLLETVLKCLEEDGVVVDERKPDVIRVAPAPLYNTYVDVYQFCRIFRRAVDVAVEAKAGRAQGSKDEEGASNGFTIT